MKEVEKYLKEGCWREALVRLWVLAKTPGTLSRWESERVTATFDQSVAECTGKIRACVPPTELQITRSSLVVVRALDEALAESASPLVTDRFDAETGQPVPYTVDGRDYYLLAAPLHNRHGIATANQAGVLGRWFQHHVVVPKTTAHEFHVTVRVSQATAQLHEALSNLAVMQGERALGAWVGHFVDGADVKWRRAENGARNWRTLCVEPAATRSESIASCLRSAEAQGAHVVVLPEFCADLAQQAALRESMLAKPLDGPVLIVAGSFHEEFESGDVFNTAALLDCNGSELFKHRKLKLFGSEKDGAEDALTGDSLHLLVTPVGTFTVLICKDFMDMAEPTASLLQEVPVDWVLVPSYGNATTLKAHKEKADQLARKVVGSSSVVAHTQNSLLDSDGPLLPGFAHACGQKRPVDVSESGGLVKLPF